ncbi:MAG TPA: hypothetical protein VMW63_06190 [Methanoregulaceae archaeon]|nr:hypothetical protein [Methanoregulaceae archaeon]
MQKETIIICLVIVFILSLIPGISGESISISPQISAIIAGEETELVITIDEVPEGLSGYNISVIVENPQVAEIVSVSYPGWVAFSNIFPPPPGGYVYMTASDLKDEVHPGDQDIDLGYVTIHGLNQGGTAVTLGVNRLSAESGDDIIPSVSGAKITVTSGSVPGGGGSSGGGGGGTGIFSSTITLASTLTPTASPTSVKAADTPIAMPSVTTAPGGGAVAQETGGHTPGSDTPASPGEEGTGPGGLPWTWIIGAIVVIVVINLAGISYYKLRKNS